jgi:GTPase
VIGNVDSGKSTLVGVLAKMILDDGRGAARSKVFNYSHELATGRTSSISHEILGFKDGTQVEPPHTKNKNDIWGHIVENSNKVITMLDLCGHEKYLKTTVFGLTSHFPDYAMIIVGANMGVQRMTKEHLGIALALKIPLFIVLTKIDIAPDTVMKDTLETIKKLILMSGGHQRKPVVVTKDDDLQVTANFIKDDAIAPIFPISNVTGEGVDEVRRFISMLQNR